MYGLQHGDGAASRVYGAIDPGIAMIARHDQRLGPRIPTHGANHIPNGAELVNLFQVQLHRGWSGTDMVEKRQPTFPAGGGFGSAEVFENRGGIGGGNRRGGDFGQSLRVFGGDAF